MGAWVELDVRRDGAEITRWGLGMTRMRSTLGVVGSVGSELDVRGDGAEITRWGLGMTRMRSTLGVLKGIRESPLRGSWHRAKITRRGLGMTQGRRDDTRQTSVGGGDGVGLPVGLGVGAGGAGDLGLGCAVGVHYEDVGVFVEIGYKGYLALG